jgi:peptidyl-Lys metalloendopeptidase
MVMRGDPSQDDYIFLNAHTSQSVEVDLASAYDLSQAGVYTIEYIAPLMHIAGSEAEMAQTQDDLKQIVIPSNPVTVTIASSAPSTS